MTTTQQTIMKAAQNFWFWLAAISIIRLSLLCFADGDLAPDEAQYWFWSQTIDAGYFSKPPMIAWLIAMTTTLFGDGEWAVRLSAPLLHAGTATFIFLTAKSLFDQRTALFSGLGWLTLPGTSLSSFLITTDAPMLFFLSAALFCFIRILKSNHAQPALFIGLGTAIGLGLLSKYAMVYFIVASAIILILSEDARHAFLKPAAILTPLIAAILFAPNFLWNLAHDFQTVTHTAANANWTSSLFHPAALGTFFAGQFGVFGPVAFAALIVIVFNYRQKRSTLDPAVLSLLVFTLTPLLIVSTQSFLSRAHANWAAAAYPAAMILITFALIKWRRDIFLKVSLAVNSIIATLMAIAMTNFAILDQLGTGRAVAELRGWQALSQAIAVEAEKNAYDAILFDDRSMIAAMLYYAPNAGPEIAALDPNSGVHHHYEAFLPFRPTDHKRSLFVSILPTDAHINYRFGKIERLGDAVAPIGHTKIRSFALFEIDDYYGPDPLPDGH